MDEPSARQQPRTRPRSVADAPRHPDRAGRDGRTDGNRSRSCPIWCSRPTRGWSTATASSVRASATRCAPARRRTSTPGSPPTVSRWSICRRASTSRGRVTPCSAARRCSPATAFAATSAATSTSPPAWDSGAAAGTGQSVLLPPGYLLLSAGARRGDYHPEAFDTYGRKVLENAHPQPAAGQRGGGALVSAATPSWSAKRWSPTPAARN